MPPFLSNSQLVVDLSAIRANLAVMHKSFGPSVKIIPVLKSDAYGLGAVPIAKALAEADPGYTFAVAQACEALALRAAGITGPIAVLAGVPSATIPALVEQSITLTVFTPQAVRLVGEEAARQGKTEYPVQIKIDTGLNRIGAKPGEELAAVANALLAQPSLAVVGTFSHFADGEHKNSPLAAQQLRLYREALTQLEAAGIQPGLRHIAASGSSEWFSESLLGAARIGRRLYLDAPYLPGAAPKSGAIKDAFTWHSSIIFKKHLEPGEAVGYDRAFVAETPMEIAVVGVGYGDGLLPELVALKAPVLVGGKKGRLVATCMDQCFIDVTGLECGEGTEVVFFGRAETGETLPAQEVAALIGHEGVYITSKLAPRVERVYLP